MPKLQGYVFLGLDIRHLTIHNSSLAVLEESSLSSIGECMDDIWWMDEFLSNLLYSYIHTDIQILKFFKNNFKEN